MHLSRDDFAAWLGRYIAAWRSRDPRAIGDLFSADCSYSYRAGKIVVVGREAIIEAWLAEPDDGAWEAHYEPLAIEQEVHVSIGWTRYLRADATLAHEYSNIFVCRFDDIGQCSEFTEWWMLTAESTAGPDEITAGPDEITAGPGEDAASEASAATPEASTAAPHEPPGAAA
jgi:hypothetical protein